MSWSALRGTLRVCPRHYRTRGYVGAQLWRACSPGQHFDLVSETDVRHAREHVAAEIAPLLRELIVRAEEALARDEQNARSLRTKVGAPWPRHTLTGQATEVLSELDTPSKPKTSPSILDTTTPGSSVASMVAQAELDEHRRQLAELQQERKRLADRVAALERRDGAIPASSTKPAQETPPK